MDVHEIYGVLKYRMVFKLNVEIIHPYDQIKKKIREFFFLQNLQENMKNLIINVFFFSENNIRIDIMGGWCEYIGMQYMENIDKNRTSGWAFVIQPKHKDYIHITVHIKYSV